MNISKNTNYAGAIRKLEKALRKTNNALSKEQTNVERMKKLEKRRDAIATQLTNHSVYAQQGYASYKDDSKRKPTGRKNMLERMRAFNLLQTLAAKNVERVILGAEIKEGEKENDPLA